MPESPRGWLTWAAYVLESQSRPFSAILERTPGTDPRLRDSRETALSVKMALERAAGNNGGMELLLSLYVDDFSWHSFTV